MPEIADWLFTPISWAAKFLDDWVSANLGGVVLLFAWASTIAIMASMLTAFAIYEVLLRLDFLIGRIALWSIRGGNVDMMHRTASHYVATRAVLARLRYRTGVSTDRTPQAARSLQPWLTRRQPRGSRLVRALLFLPVVAMQISRFTMHWLRTPAGLYLALGSIWVALRPTDPVSALGDRLVEFWRSISNSVGLAVVAALLAAAALALDHGMKSRTRGRNAFLQTQAAAAAATLEQISDVAVELRESVHALIDDHIGLYPIILSSAVECATRDCLTVRKGTVAMKRYVTRSWIFSRDRPNWRLDQPLGNLANDYPPLAELRRNEANLLADVALVRDAVGDWDHYWKIRRQAPAAARGPLSELIPATGREVAQGAGPHTTHKIVAFLDTTRLEYFGRDLVRRVEEVILSAATSRPDIHDPECDGDVDSDEPLITGACAYPGMLEEIQQVLDEKADEFVNNLWRACCFAAEMGRLVRAIDRDHNTRGFASRLGY